MISIVLFTYNRPDYARRTLASVIKNLHSDEPLWCHISDDGSPQEQRLDLLDMAHAFFQDRVSISNSERRGYGGSYNLATQYVHEHSDIMLPLEDDWELTRPLYIDALAAVLRSASGVDCIRMGYLGTTQELRGQVIHVTGQTFLLLDPNSPEPHVFAGHPRLETREFQRRVGPWPEDRPAGETEFMVSQRSAARRGVAWPMDLCHAWGDLWAHIGTIPSEEAEVRGDPREAEA